MIKELLNMNKKLKAILPIIGLILVVLIFNLMNTNANEDADTTISSQEATEIALDYLGVGTAIDATLMEENGVAIYEVEIEENEDIRFLVYVHAETGDVVRMSRFEEGYEGITTLPEILPPGELELETEDE